MSLHVAWHDVECGGYAADLPLWRALADAMDGPVLDVGAGTGRVTLDLARHGHAVVALDVDAELLGALRERAEGLPVETVVGDARSFQLGGRRFGLVLAPMQTVQLLGGPEGRAGFLAAAHAHLAPGGLAAAALAEEVEPFEATTVAPPAPDVGELDGARLESRPIAVRDEGERLALVRLRQVAGPDGRLRAQQDVVCLDRLTAAAFEAEARAAGLRVLPRRAIAATDDHVGSTVVVLRG